MSTNRLRRSATAIAATALVLGGTVAVAPAASAVRAPTAAPAATT